VNIASSSIPSPTDPSIDARSASPRSPTGSAALVRVAPWCAGAAALSVVPALALLSSPAHAYVGPGAGLGVIGTLFGIGAAIVLAMFGLFWYPLKRAFGRKSADAGAGTNAAASTDEPLPADAAEPDVASPRATAPTTASAENARPE